MISQMKNILCGRARHVSCPCISNGFLFIMATLEKFNKDICIILEDILVCGGFPGCERRELNVEENRIIVVKIIAMRQIGEADI